MKKSNKIALAVLGAILVAALVMCGVSWWQSRTQIPAGLADVDWYDETGEEFTITTKEELYGLAKLSEDYDFKGQTIKLGQDIVVNEGDAEEWLDKAPEHLWIPVQGFAGHFDGQGHTISGVYGDAIITSLGLFTDTQKTCVIEDFKLVNSCFKNNNDMGTGSIVGFGGGKLKNIYSDAIMTGSGQYVGGLIGRVTAKGENQISNCWFDGTITMKGNDASDVGGIVGAFSVEDAISVIEHCLSTAEIYCMGDRTGGICGNIGSGSFVNLNDSMFTGTLTYDTNKYDTIGSVVAEIAGSSTAMLRDTYTVDEIANRTIGTNSGYQEGSAIAIAKTQLVGKGGYQWTTLDFDTYWSAQKDDMPILTYFAEQSESVEGLSRLVDLSWYNPTGGTFVIKTMEQFYGFAYLSRSYDFRGQTIQLGADITVNEGSAENWGEEPPLYKWAPIGWHGTSLSKRFKGTFDGQGYTISGIYAKGNETNGYIGLFGEVYNGATVKNVRIVNSYFEGTMPSNVRGCVGSVCGRNRGTIEGVYSSAIIVNSAKMTGGMAGMINGIGQNRIANCWFDGKITGVSRTGGMLGGVYGNKASIEATIENCLNTGDISVKIGYGDVGGMCGIAETWCTLYIKDCLNAGTFQTVGEGKKANTHIGTIFGSVTQTSGVGSKVEITNSFGVKDFYSRIVGWKYDAAGISQASVAYVTAEELIGYGGYQWTTLDFKEDWAIRTNDIPVPVNFATSRPSVSGVTRMVDYSWYDANKDVFTIKTMQQLYGFARLWDVANQFKNKTVRLGANITLNEGNAADWGTTAPAFVWTPAKLSGTFDGQGHTISGIYVKGGEEDNYLGLFHRVYKGGVLKNVKLVNSYIEGTMPNNKRGAVGSIAGRNNGIIDAVYSDAIVVNSARMTGGIVGMITGDGENKISSSWFDGQLTGITRMGGILGGVYGNEANITATIEHCLNTGDIAVQIGYGDVGGLCGMVETYATLNLTDSLNAGTFKTIGEGKEANTHIGTLVGSVTKTDNMGSKAVLKHTYGTEEFYNRLVGWSYAKGAEPKSSVSMVSRDEIIGNNGYEWTTLDFDKYWSVRTNDVPVPRALTVNASSVSGLSRKVDFSWYDENSDTYVINTPQQLYGFLMLCDVEHDYFSGKTIKLGADISLNSGDASTWGTKAPENVWTPVNFKGTLDGQGHTLSGVYVKSDGTYTGFFSTLQSGAVVKDLNLENSYIEGTSESGKRNGVGSIAGRNHGTIDTVKSSAIVVNSALMTGGIAGMTTSDDTENVIKNCWFDGKIYANSSTGGILGGTYKSTATVSNCLNTGVLTMTADAKQVGGLIGFVQSTSDVQLTNSLNAGSLEQADGVTVSQVGNLVGAVHADASIDADDVYGNNEFSAKKFGYQGGDAAVSGIAGRAQAQLKGTAVYQWTTLDFEDTDGNGEDQKYWVLKEGTYPTLKVFDKEADDSALLAEAKTLLNFTWYDPDVTEYVIDTKNKLLEFNVLCADSSTNNFAGKTVKLGADITLNKDDTWKVNVFRGTFDGNWHTLSGVQVIGTEKEQYVGLFSRIYATGIVQNLTLKDSSFEGNYTGNEAVYGVGSIAGRSNGVIQNVHSSATVKNSRIYTGGIVGIIYEGTDNNTVPNKISNCWYDGTIYSSGKSGGILGGAHTALTTVEHCLNSGMTNILSGAEDAVGGLVGYVRSSAILTLKDSLNVGTYEEPNEEVKQIGTAVGAHNSTGKIVITDVYGIDSFCKESVGPALFGYSSAKNVTQTSSAYRTAEQLQGAAAYQWTTLDFEDTDEEGEDQKYWILKDGTYPTLRVFDKTTDDTTLLTTAKTLLDYTWYDAESAQYVLNTPKQLLGFNALCSQEAYDNFAGKTVKLGANITLNEVSGDTDAAKKAAVLAWENSAPAIKWNPTNFKGTFDGQGNAINGVYVKQTLTSSQTNLYTGFFRTIEEGATVKNLKLQYSFVGVSGATGRNPVGSIAGRNKGTIDSVFSNAIVKTTTQMAGGIAGYSDDGTNNLITNCWYDGDLYSTQRDAGGILGGTYQAKVTMEHCLNTGTLHVTAGKATLGGLLGYARTNSDITLKDCLNAGELDSGTGTASKQTGTIAGGYQGTLIQENVYGISDGGFQREIGYQPVDLKTLTLESIKGLNSAASNLTYYESADDLTNPEPRTCWWIARDGKIPMLADFKTLAETLNK